MAEKILARRPALTLDNLPVEIIDKVWRHYFLGSRISCCNVIRAHDGRLSIDLGPLWLINKTQSLRAKDAMLRHAVVQITDPFEVSSLLCNSKSLAEIRCVEISGLSTKHFPFTLMDDFLRAMPSLEEVQVWVYSCLTVPNISHDEVKRTVGSCLLKAVKKDAQWTKQMLTNTITSCLYTSTRPFLDDIIHEMAFEGSPKRPRIRINMSCWLAGSDANPATLTYQPNDSNHLPILIYYPGSRLLRTTIADHTVSMEQRLLAKQVGSRGNRGMLCDAGSTDKTLQDALENALGRCLDPRERLVLAGGESCRFFDAPVDSFEGHMCSAIGNLWRWSLAQKECWDVVDWLERKLNSPLRVSNFEQALVLLKNGLRREPDEFESAVLLRTWEANLRKGSFECSMDLYHFLVPAVSVQCPTIMLWGCCFDAMYCRPNINDLINAAALPDVTV